MIGRAGYPPIHPALLVFAGILWTVVWFVHASSPVQALAGNVGGIVAIVVTARILTDSQSDGGESRDG